MLSEAVQDKQDINTIEFLAGLEDATQSGAIHLDSDASMYDKTLPSYRVEHGQQLDELVNMTRQAQESVSAQHKPIDSAG